MRADLERLAREALAAYVTEGPEAFLPYLSEDVIWEEDPEWPDGRERARTVFEAERP